MSTPNPLAPQGSMLEKHARGRSTFQIISFIGAIHVVALCGLLWIGCKKDDQAGNNPGSGIGGLDPQGSSGLPPVDPGLPPIGSSATPIPGISNAPLPSTVGGAGGAGPTAFPVGGGTPAGSATPPTGTATGSAPVSTGLPPAGGGLAPLPAGNGGGLPPVDGSLPPSNGATTTVGAGEYKVQSGDTGSKIATKAGVKLAALKAANPGVDWNRLKVNQTLVVPAPTAPAPGSGTAPAGSAGTTGVTPTADAGTSAGGTTYTVRPGDNGMRIAKKTGVPWKSIRTANGLTSDNIRAGQKLTIPAKGAPATPPTANPPSGSGAVTPSATPLPSLPAGQ